MPPWLRTTSLAVLAGLLAQGMSPAKPPDLPVDETVLCQPSGPQTPVSPPPASLPNPPAFGCPYLNRQATPKPASGEPARRPVSVLDNLVKLGQAQQLYDQAEHDRLTGHIDAARATYELVRTICPGSRLDELAAQRLGELRAPANSEPLPTAAEEEGAPPDQPAIEELPAPDPIGTVLRVDLPPLDPRLVDALERLLAETGDPEMPKLIVLDQEPAPTERAEADPGLGWPLTPIDPDLANRLAAETDPGPDADEEAAEEDEEEALPEAPPDWNALLHEVLDAIHAGTCIEIDGSNLDRLRLQCQRQVGGVLVHIVTDDDGVWQCTVVSLVPGAGGDLRAAQRAHNESILHWIEAVSEGPAEDPADDDPDDGDDALDESPRDG
jgi:hypothetical protein